MLSLSMLATGPMLAAPASAEKAMRLSEFVAICDRSQGGTCRAYVAGVADGSRIFTAATKAEPLFCVPEQLAEAQIVATVVGLAREDVRKYPPDDGMLAASYIGAVLLNSYPCK